jgi:hypothetical protein
MAIGIFDMKIRKNEKQEIDNFTGIESKLLKILFRIKEMIYAGEMKFLILK